MDVRTEMQRARRSAGQCLRCGRSRDRMGSTCQQCRAILNARNRQRYRPGMPAAEWTMAFLARFSAIELRGLL